MAWSSQVQTLVSSSEAAIEVPAEDKGRHEVTAAARLVRLRWVAIVVVVASIGAAAALGALEDARPLYLIAVLLAAANAAFTAAVKARPASSRGIAVQIFVDLVALTGLLHFAGGVGNPLVVLYVVHAILAAMLLPRRQSFWVAGSACLLFKAMAFGELFRVFSHHPLRLVARSPELTATLAADPIYVLALAGICLLMMGTAVFFVSGVMEDLRSRQAAVRRAQGRLQAVIDSIQDSIVLFDAAGKPVACNRAMRADDCRLASGQDGQLAAVDALTVPGCSSCPKWPYGGRSPAAVWTALGGRSGGVCSEEHEVEGRFFRHRLFPVDGTSAGAGMVWVVEEVTERRRLEAQARHQDRMAAAGLLAAGVAHEIRNPLASISAVVEDLNGSVEDATLSQDLSTVASHVYRISRVLGQLSGLASPPSEERAAVDVNAAVGEALDIVRIDPRWRAVALINELDEELPQVMANHDELVQVFVNLALNALEAMPDGGEFAVSSSASNGEVRVEFRDAGSGIQAAVLGRIFDPFFTTKDSQEGAGLGLSVSDSIVRAHGGRITVESEEGKGSALTVRLPAVLSSPEGSPEAPGTSQDRTARRHPTPDAVTSK
ncbi:MAG: nitrogen regulation protein NR(II) [Acidobacteriota bacterium]